MRSLGFCFNFFGYIVGIADRMSFDDSENISSCVTSNVTEGAWKSIEKSWLLFMRKRLNCEQKLG